MKKFILLALALFGPNALADGRIMNVDINSGAKIVYSKMEDVASGSIIGRVAGGAGPATALTASQVGTLLGVAADAFELAYTPTNLGDWSVAPANVGDALDELAARDYEATTVTDTNSVNLTLTGDDITADVKLSASAADAGNINAINTIETDGIQTQVPIATTSVTGVITDTDWDTFNNKQAALPLTTKGDILTRDASGYIRFPVCLDDEVMIADTGETSGWRCGAAASVLTFSDTDSIDLTRTLDDITADLLLSASAADAGHINAVNTIESDGLQVQVPIASTSVTGVVTDTDWDTFNNKQPAGNYITALTSDVTASGPGSVAATIAADAVTNAKMADMATMTIKGNDTGGAANPQDLTGTEVTAMLDVFTATEKGLVPLSGGGTTTFLRADGTFATPAAGGDVSSNTATSVDGEIALFNGTTGKSIKRATGTGYAKLASGVLSAQSTPIPAADVNGGRTINPQTGTTYTFALADGSKAGGFPLVSLANASPITATIDTNANVAFPVGTQIDVSNDGTGVVTIAPAGGVTVNSSVGLTLSQYGAGSLVKTATNVWNFYSGVSGGITDLTGDVSATGPDSAVATLATVNGNVGSFTYGSFTVNAKGLITAASSGTAPVTSISVASANGLAGNSSGGQTPALTLSTTVTGNVCANGTAFSACGVTGSGNTVLATSPTLVTPTLGVAAATTINKVAFTAPATGSTLTIADGKTFTSSNTLTLAGTDGSTLNIGTGGTLGTAAYTAASAYEVPLTFSTGLTRSTNTITVNTSQNIATLSNLTTNGFVKTSGGAGTLGVQTSPIPSSDIGGTRTINAQTGTTYTFVLADGSGAGGYPLVTGANAAAQTFTVPPNSSVAYPTGTQIDVCQTGAGKLTLAQGAGVTINSLSGNKAIGGQYVCVSLVTTATDVWLLTGNLIP
jgi:hypothetical protein